MIKQYLIIFSVFLMSSCSVLIKKIFLGIRKPKIENEISLNKVLLKNDIDTSNAFLLKDKLHLELITTNTNYFSKYEVYNSSFEKIIPSDSLIDECYGRISLALKEVSDTKKWIKDTSSYVSPIILQKNMLKLSGETAKTPIFNVKGKDYFVIFYWTKFMGRYSKSLLEMAKDVKNLDSSNINVFTINMDKNVYMSDSIKNIPYLIN